MAHPYHHLKIEPKWQRVWNERGVFRASEDPADARKRRYILDMFPYPSGAGLHVGHPEGYTATDVVARYWRMRGENVLHTMGWDAFGLPAENYAIKTGVHPHISTTKNIDTFRRQIQSIGFSYDWQREISTADPSYYRWTQWLFLFLYNRGLAERKEARVNWCESCKTVLANEQVVSDRTCERCGNPVVLKSLKQWFFTITQYADKLLDELAHLDWPEGILAMQRNWIGRSEGLVVTHAVKDTSLTLDTFTTTPAWSYADTFVALAPEHPQLRELVRGTSSEKEVLAFIEQQSQRQERERTGADAPKEGVNTGRVVIDPFDGRKLPVWVANYVLPQFGTGAVRASAHDARDAAFAAIYKIPLKEVVDRPMDPSTGTASKVPVDAHTGTGVLKDSGPFTGKDVRNAAEDVIAWAVKQGWGTPKTSYKIRDWLVSRQRYWGAPIPIVYDNHDQPYPIPESHLPVLLPDDVDFRPTGESPLVTSKAFHDAKALKRIEDELKAQGVLATDRHIVRRESDTLDGFVCSAWYMYRFADPDNRHEFVSADALKRWLPVNLYVGGAEHAVLHLLYARFVAHALHAAGMTEFKEPFLALRNQGMILAEDGRKMSKRWGNVINPDDVIHQHGADTLRMYELFMGPIEEVKPWSQNGVRGVRRFLEKTWHVCMDHAATDHPTPPETRTLLHSTIKQIADDIEAFKFNTSVSALMILMNHVAEDPATRLTHEVAGAFVRILSPFAPHMAEELFAHLQPERSAAGELVCQLEWPQVDPQALIRTTVNIGVQINGKTRGTIQIAPDASQEDALAAAKATDVWKRMENANIQRIVYVPGRILNVIVAS